MMGDNEATKELLFLSLGKYRVNNKLFVAAWQQARSLPELVTAMGMRDGARARLRVQRHADRLRGQGVRLKALSAKHHLTEAEVAELNGVVERVERRSGRLWLLLVRLQERLRGKAVKNGRRV